MKFDPVLFIKIAQRNGLILTRIEKDISVKSANSKIWIQIIRRHKRQLLKHLPEDEIKSLQVYLFEDL